MIILKILRNIIIKKKGYLIIKEKGKDIPLLYNNRIMNITKTNTNNISNTAIGNSQIYSDRKRKLLNYQMILKILSNLRLVI